MPYICISIPLLTLFSLLSPSLSPALSPSLPVLLTYPLSALNRLTSHLLPWPSRLTSPRPALASPFPTCFLPPLHSHARSYSRPICPAFLSNYPPLGPHPHACPPLACHLCLPSSPSSRHPSQSSHPALLSAISSHPTHAGLSPTLIGPLVSPYPFDPSRPLFSTPTLTSTLPTLALPFQPIWLPSSPELLLKTASVVEQVSSTDTRELKLYLIEKLRQRESILAPTMLPSLSGTTSATKALCPAEDLLAQGHTSDTRQMAAKA
ncbi:hypothetical protein EI94DRAFT_1814122 [Lactarius quietus]|nr:hypothetical protein EI94DRAFT_1814122 [Lactarius quietus]